FDRGTYMISDFLASKRTGRVRGRISAHEKKGISWDLETTNLTLAEVDNITRLDVPHRGDLKLFSRASGQLEAIDPEAFFNLTNTSVRGRFMPASELAVKSAKGLITLKGSALGGQGTLDASFAGGKRTRSFVKAQFRRLDFSPLLLLLNPKHLQDTTLRGYI